MGHGARDRLGTGRASRPVIGGLGLRRKRNAYQYGLMARCER